MHNSVEYAAQGVGNEELASFHRTAAERMGRLINGDDDNGRMYGSTLVIVRDMCEYFSYVCVAVFLRSGLNKKIDVPAILAYELLPRPSLAFDTLPEQRNFICGLIHCVKGTPEMLAVPALYGRGHMT